MTGVDPELDRAVWNILYKASPPVGQRRDQPVSSALGLLTGRVVRL
jgi:hypothetical protein